MDGLQVFFDLVVASGVVFFAVGQWRSGRNQKELDALSTANSTIDLLTKRADAFQKELEEMKKLHHENELKIAKLEEANKHKDALLDQYLKIITNRNPDLENTLKDVRNFLEALNKKIGDGLKISSTHAI